MDRTSGRPFGRRLLATLFGPVDRLWTAGTAGTAADRRAFDHHARRLTAVNLQVTAVSILALSVLAWPTDALLFAPGSAQADAVFAWRIAILAVCGASYAVLRAGLRVPPAAVGVAAYAAIMGASGWLMGGVGGLESPLFYGIYTAPLMTVMLVVGLAVRIAATLVVVGVYLVAFVAADPSHLAHPHLGTPLVWLSASAVTAVVVGQVVTHLLRANYLQRRTLSDLTGRLEQRVADQTGALRELAANLSRVQEEERLRLARELHDELGQILTGLQMELDLLRRQLAGDGALAEGVDRAGALLETVNDAVDRVVTALRPTALDRGGLYAALAALAATVEARHGVACSVALEIDEERLDDAKTIAVFRVVQEGLTNVVRHARASRVRVAIGGDGDTCVVRVEDDGAGFDVTAATGTGHFGLLGVRERARMLGGRCDIRSTPGAGTTVAVSFPIPDSERRDVA